MVQGEEEGCEPGGRTRSRANSEEARRRSSGGALIGLGGDLVAMRPPGVVLDSEANSEQ